MNLLRKSHLNLLYIGWYRSERILRIKLPGDRAKSRAEKDTARRLMVMMVRLAEKRVSDNSSICICKFNYI